MFAALYCNIELLFHEVSKRDIFALRDLVFSCSIVCRASWDVGEIVRGPVDYSFPGHILLCILTTYLEIIEHGMSDKYSIFQNIGHLFLDFIEGFRFVRTGGLARETSRD